MGGFSQDLKRFGPARALCGLVMRRLQKHCGIHLFAINSRPFDPQAPVDVLPEGHSIRYLDATDLEGPAADPVLAIAPAMAQAALARGDVCVGYFVHDRLVSYYWCAFGETPMEDGWWVRFPAGYAYSYKGLTLPAYRGQHLQHRLTHVNERTQSKRGYHSNIEYIAVHNLASRAASERSGNRTIGYAGFLRWLGVPGRGAIRRAFHSAGARRVGFRIFRPGQTTPP